jgi:hypothetical protein
MLPRDLYEERRDAHVPMRRAELRAAGDAETHKVETVVVTNADGTAEIYGWLVAGNFDIAHATILGNPPACGPITWGHGDGSGLPAWREVVEAVMRRVGAYP